MARDNPMHVRNLLETLVQTQIILTDSPPEDREPNTLYFGKDVSIIGRVRGLIEHYLRCYHAAHRQSVDPERFNQEVDDIMRIAYGVDYGKVLELNPGVEGSLVTSGAVPERNIIYVEAGET